MELELGLYRVVLSSVECVVSMYHRKMTRVVRSICVWFTCIFAIGFIIGLSLIVRGTISEDTSQIMLEPSLSTVSYSSYEETTQATEPIETVIVEPEVDMPLPSVEPVDPTSQLVVVETESTQSSDIESDPGIPLAEPSESSDHDEPTMPVEPVETIEPSDSLADQQTENASSVAIPEVVEESMPETPEPPPAEEPAIPANEHPGEYNVQLPTVQSGEPVTEKQTTGEGGTGVEGGVGNVIPGQEEEKFATFEEWSAQARAEQEKTKQEQEEGSGVHPNGVVAKVIKVSRNNYASHECGSKILSTNPECENSKSILNNNKDEYLINPCSSKNWFVVELCEPIQIQSLELASFELFSSQPHRFTVYLSDWYPPKDWRVLASFEASEDRGIQSFQIQDDIFVKYVKVEMVDHYGEEHYCPLTLFRVYGVALADEEEEGESPQKSDPVVGDATTTEEPSNLFESAKDTVMSLVKKVLKVEGGNGTAEHLNSTANASTPDAQKPNISEDGTILPCVPNGEVPSVTIATIQPSATQTTPELQSESVESQDADSAEHSIVTKLEDHEQPQFSQSITASRSADQSSIRAIASNCCSSRVTKPPTKHRTKNTRVICLYFRLFLSGHKSRCVRILKADEITNMQLLKSQPQTQSIVETDTVATTNATIAVTKTESTTTPSISHPKIHTTSMKHSESSRILTNDESTTKLKLKTISKDDKPCKSQGILDLEPSVKTCTSIPQTNKLSEFNIQSPQMDKSYTGDVLESSFVPFTSKIIDLSSITPVLDAEATTKTIITPPKITIETKNTESEISPSDTQEMLKTSEILSAETIEPTQSTVPMATETVQPSNPELNAMKNSEPNGKTPELKTTSESNGKNPELKVVKANDVSKHGSEDEKLSNTVHVPVNAVSKRETQIMRLSNRVKTLELNVSLSSRFLEELSQRYRKKSEDLMKMLNSTTAKLVNATTAVSIKEQSQTLEMKNLESRVDDLDDKLTRFAESLESLCDELRERQIVWATIEILVASLLFLLYFLKQRPVYAPVPPKTTRTRPVTVSNLIDTPNRHTRKHSADDVITIHAGETPGKKRHGSAGNLGCESLDPDFHIVQPIQDFVTDFGKPPDGRSKKKKKRSQKQILTSSHSDLANISTKNTTNNAKPPKQKDTLQSQFSSAGLLFAADENYQQQKSRNKDKPTLKKSKSNSHDLRLDLKSQNHNEQPTLKRAASQSNKHSLFNGKRNSGKTTSPTSIRLCNLENLPPLRSSHDKNGYQEKIRPVIKT